MKIAHYSTFLSRSAGGLFYSVSGLANAQAEAGADVFVVGGADHYLELDRKQWRSVDLRPHQLSTGSYGLSLQALRDLTRCKPDLIHVHGIWSAASLYARVFSSAGIPVVVSPRGMLDRWILARRSPVKRVHGALLERPTLRKAHVHALNLSEYESVKRYLPAAAARTFVVPNGVSEHTDKEPRKRTGVLYIGRLHAKKQVIELARHWRSTPDLQDIELTIAGWGDSDYEGRLVEEIAGVDNVRFVGSLYGEEKRIALSSARFFILPSLSEGLPMAVLEALQAGAIPVITDKCNLPEVLDAGVALRIKTNFEDTAKVVTDAERRSEEDLARLSAAGREFSRRYLWPSIAQQMAAHYDSILAGSRP
ncbi:glycosyltransferase [Mycobacterium yunnanensis]|uniref:Glycosyltransferase n=1 Tax=Mycobacterium yunnanensis TaxID=368477 RepID=A0A9X2YLA4_9MYCO|nr:glycosyltransferase [Mycobacterium yunnanensis]